MNEREIKIEKKYKHLKGKEYVFREKEVDGKLINRFEEIDCKLDKIK